ncbi:MAG TPA: DnaJ domain-containing protein, partial [Fimbriimonadaceae bacterium]|nr:DnaJ domain-containing protein [Fimbriimonadaceae bacterium]
MPTLYDILGVERTAEPASLRRAYRRLAQKYHPDVNPDPKSHDLMARINEAFATLIDPSRRNEYDAMLAGGFGQPTQPRTEAKKPMQVKLLRRLPKLRTPVYAIGFAVDSGHLITGSFDNEIIWWDQETGTPKRRTRLESGVISTLKPLEGDRLVAAGSVESTVSIWELSKG